MQCIDKIDKKTVQRGPCYLGSKSNNSNTITTFTNNNNSKLNSTETINDKRLLATDKVKLVKKITKADSDKKIDIIYIPLTSVQLVDSDPLI